VRPDQARPQPARSTRLACGVAGSTGGRDPSRHRPGRKARARRPAQADAGRMGPGREVGPSLPAPALHHRPAGSASASTSGAGVTRLSALHSSPVALRTGTASNAYLGSAACLEIQFRKHGLPGSQAKKAHAASPGSRIAVNNRGRYPSASPGGSPAVAWSRPTASSPLRNHLLASLGAGNAGHGTGGFDWISKPNVEKT